MESEVKGLRNSQIHMYRNLNDCVYTLVWMARISEELKKIAIDMGIEGPHTSWWHMFGWNTFGLLLMGPAVATHRFFRTLNAVEKGLNCR